MTMLLAGLVLGLAGSAHCVGMCGPLVLLAGRPISSTRLPDRLGLSRPLLLHHAARLAVYLVFGAIAGTAGQTLAAFGWQRVMAVTAGAALLIQALGAAGRAFDAWRPRWPAAIVARLGATARRLPAGHLARPILFGAINGLMPCGLLYAALAAAAGVGQLSSALLFIAAFGLGSLPAFSVLILSAHFLTPRLPGGLRQATPVVLALLGVLLIMRGWPGELMHAVGLHTPGHMH